MNQRQALVGWLFAFLLMLAVPCARAGPLAPEVEACLECHGNETLEMPLPSGENQSLYVDQDTFAKSIHGETLRCTDCHTDIEGYPHPERTFKNKREFSLAYYESCKTCHFDQYTKSLDSVHYEYLSKGDPRAPLCVDCHGAHNVAKPDVPRSRISQTCARCHPQVYERYAHSVHGKALLNGENADVPVCTDCHRSHDIEDPRTAAFRLRSPEICASCHTNKKIMAKYDLSTNVLQTYLEDFHGVTASFLKEQRAVDGGRLTAVCIDCHGVHDILPVNDPRSSVIKANLVTTCRKCHPDANPNFPAAWLSHYEPSFKKAPLVYLVQLFYRFFIPFVVLGLVLQILLHIWRAVVSR